MTNLYGFINKHHDKFSEKGQKYEDEGIENGRERASEKMCLIYKSDLKTEFFNILYTLHRLRKSQVYDQVMEDFNTFEREKIYSRG